VARGEGPDFNPLYQNINKQTPVQPKKEGKGRERRKGGREGGRKKGRKERRKGGKRKEGKGREGKGREGRKGGRKGGREKGRKEGKATVGCTEESQALSLV
jgi:hypothetical protein